MMSQNIRHHPPSDTSHIPEEWKSKLHHCKSLKTDICIYVCVNFLVLSFFLSSLYFVLSFSPLCLIHLIHLDILCFDTVGCTWEHLNLPHSIAIDASSLHNCTLKFTMCFIFLHSFKLCRL